MGAARVIARLWHGRVPLEKADAYAVFLEARALPDYRAVPGNLGAYVLRRDEGGVAHFATLSWWESEGAVRAFAGDAPLRAKYYPEDAGFLLGFEPEVVHYALASRA